MSVLGVGGGSGIGWLVLGARDLICGVRVARPGSPVGSRCWRSHLSSWTSGVGVQPIFREGGSIGRRIFSEPTWLPAFGPRGAIGLYVPRSRG